jgi:hypothetical protein
MKTIQTALFLFAVLSAPVLAVQTPIYTVFSDAATTTDDIFVWGASAGYSVYLDSSVTQPAPPEGFHSLRATAGPYTSDTYPSTFAFMYLTPYRTNRSVDLSAYAASGEIRLWLYCDTDNFETLVQHANGAQDGFYWNGVLASQGALNQWVLMEIPTADIQYPYYTGPEISYADLVSPLAIMFHQPGTCYVDDVRYVNPPAPGADIFNVAVKNISDQSPAPQLTWSAPDPALGWARSNQYIELQVDSVSEGWGVQIYTVNTDAAANPQYIVSGSSNPAGMIDTSDGHFTIPLAWSVKAGTQAPSAVAPHVAEPNNNGGSCAPSGNPDPNNAYQWLYMQDAQTPSVPYLCQDGFQYGNAFSLIRNNQGIHYGQKSTEFGAQDPPNDIFLEANFGAAFAQHDYRTNAIIVEFFNY